MKAKIVFVHVVFDFISFKIDTGEMSVLQNVKWRISSQSKMWGLGDIFSGRRGN